MGKKCKLCGRIYYGNSCTSCNTRGSSSSSIYYDNDDCNCNDDCNDNDNDNDSCNDGDCDCGGDE